jgi:hypothetical protein
VKLWSKVLTTVSLVAAVATPVVVVSPAHAASRDGRCGSGEFCYYYNSNEQGSVSDFKGSVDDYRTTQPTCYEFKGRGRGRGLCVKNNAASVWTGRGTRCGSTTAATSPVPTRTSGRVPAGTCGPC